MHMRGIIDSRVRALRDPNRTTADVAASQVVSPQTNLENGSVRVSLTRSEVFIGNELRHSYPPENVAALKRHLLDDVPVSTICDQLCIAPALLPLVERTLREWPHRL